MLAIEPSPSDALGSLQTVPREQSVLAAAYLGSTLQVIAATSPRGLSCCSSLQAITADGRGKPGAPRTLLRGLAGPALAELIPLPGGGAAVLATQAHVWLATDGPRGLGRPQAIAGGTPTARSLAATALAGGRALAVWNDVTPGSVPSQPPARIVIAEATSRKVGARGRVVRAAPAGHEITDLSVASRGRGATLGWTESWYDGAGARHSAEYALDLAGPRLRAGRVRALSAANVLADALTVASDPRGDELAGWRECSAATGSCDVAAALRPAAGGWRAARRLGSLDPGAAPAVALTPARSALVGWISDGRVVVSAALRAGRAAARLSPRGGAAGDLELLAGGGDTALAAWIQGNARQSVWSARFGGP